MKIKNLLKLLLVFLISISWSVAGAEENSKPVRVVLDWFINPDHAPLLVAEAKGFFKQQGLQVKIITPADPNDGPKLVAAKKAEIAITYQPQLLIQVSEGLPLMRFATLVNSPLSCLVTLKNNKISEISALKGKSIGYSAGAIDQVMLETMLQNHGLNIKDVKFINVRYDLVKALLSHNVDAFTGGMRNVEPIQIQQQGQTPILFFPEDNGFPSYDELIFVTNRENINDPRLKKFVIALKASIQYLKAHPEESWQLVSKAHPELNNALDRAAWFASIQYFDSEPEKFDPARYQALANFMFKHGIIKKLPETANYAI